MIKKLFYLVAFAFFFISCDIFTDPTAYTVSNVHVGIVAFGKEIKTIPLTNNIYSMKVEINELQNHLDDETPLCYATSTTAKILKREAKNFDYTYMITFTDGIDNTSSKLYKPSLPQGGPNNVYDKAKADIADADPYAAFVLRHGTLASDTEIKKLTFPQPTPTTDPDPFFYISTDTADIKKSFDNCRNYIQIASRKITFMINKAHFPAGNEKEINITIKTDKGDSTHQFKLTYDINAVSQAPELLETSKTGNLTIGNLDTDKKLTGKIENNKMVFSFLDLSLSGTSSKDFTIKEVVLSDTNGNIDSESMVIAHDVPKIVVMLVLDSSKSLGDKDFATLKKVSQDFLGDLTNIQKW